MEETDRQGQAPKLDAPGDPAPTPPSATDRLDLERTKIELEIRDLRRSWLLRAEYMSVWVSLILAALTATVLVSTGYFDQQSRLLEIRRENLNAEVRDLEGDKERISRENVVLEERTKHLEAERQQLLANKDRLQVDRGQLEAALVSVQQEKARLEAAVAPLRESLGEILSAAEEGIRQNRLATTRTRIYFALFGCAEVAAGDCDIVGGDDFSPGGGFSAEERRVLDATRERFLADYQKHEGRCLGRRPKNLAALPADRVASAIATWLHEFDECLQGWVLPSQRDP